MDTTERLRQLTGVDIVKKSPRQHNIALAAGFAYLPPRIVGLVKEGGYVANVADAYSRPSDPMSGTFVHHRGAPLDEISHLTADVPFEGDDDPIRFVGREDHHDGLLEDADVANR